MLGPRTRFCLGAAPWVALGVVCLRDPAVHAQVTTGTGLAGSDVTLAGTLRSSITLSVSGATNPTTGLGTTVTGVGNQGTIDFGTYNLATDRLDTGELFRVTGNTRGAYLVATLRVQTTFSGGGGTVAAVDLQRTNACGGAPDVPCGTPGSLFYSLPRGQGRTFPRWQQYPDPQYGRFVFPVPEAAFIPGAGNLASDLASGGTLDHQVAIWVPDARGDGPFSTVVTYTATRL